MTTARVLSLVERLMIYKAWGKRCVWCKRPLTYDAVEIDHLVAKSLSGVQLDRVLADYGLPKTFDLEAFPNLATSCRPCNGSKGNRPVRAAPIVVAVLDKARQRAVKISKRVAEFDRNRALSEVSVMLQAIRPTAQEMKQLNNHVGGGSVFHPGGNSYEPDPPALKTSKKNLSYAGFADDEQMFFMLEEWASDHSDDALQIVEDTFNGGDTPPQRVSPIKVNFLAYAKDVGDFLGNVTFDVDYLYVTDDVTDMAEAEHTVDLWITLDPAKRHIVDVVVDHFRSLDTCKGFR